MIDSGYAVAGAITGFVIGLTGLGGGALMTPILLVFFNVAPTTAIATDLWFAVITKLVGASFHSRAGQVDWQVVKRLWAGSLPAALLVVTFVSQGHQVSLSRWLTHAIGIVVLITASGLLLAPKLLQVARGRRLGNPVQFKKIQPCLTVFGGSILGFCVALTSVGAGALGSVMLLYLYPLRMTPHRLVATDLVHAIPLALVAGFGYFFAGVVDWNILASLLMGSLPAIIAGSLMAQRVSGRFIQVLLALTLISVSIRVLM